MKLTYKDWINLRRFYSQQEPEYYSATCENKEVRVYSIGDSLFINWYIDGKFLRNPTFPVEVENEIRLFVETLLFEVVNESFMNRILYEMSKYLPYLKDGDSEDNILRYVKIRGEIKL